jgi:hypothetical protein
MKIFFFFFSQRFTFDLDLEFLIITLTDNVAVGNNYQLSIEFTGADMDKRIVGLYSSTYVNTANNASRYGFVLKCNYFNGILRY